MCNGQGTCRMDLTLKTRDDLETGELFKSKATSRTSENHCLVACGSLEARCQKNTCHSSRFGSGQFWLLLAQDMGLEGPELWPCLPALN